MTISHASFAISVPAMPKAKPTSASFKAGASFVPSPVTETTSPSSLCKLHKTNLSVGDERAKTRIFIATDSCSARDIFLKTGPSKIVAPFSSSFGSNMPASIAMARAVTALSPVTMRTVTPRASQKPNGFGRFHSNRIFNTDDTKQRQIFLTRLFGIQLAWVHLQIDVRDG